jgi:isoleucyl-tRNA synthetase
MSFRPVEQAIPNFPELERRILALWEKRNVFARTLQESKGKPEFVFYEGPPTANGLPHNGHVLTRVIKDLFPRYKTMRGYHVERRAGWDTHGLPVEVEVERELGISGKQAIIDYGVDKFAKKCLQSVFRYTAEWEHLTRRIGFWVDLDKAYVTYHKAYVESVWWALSELFKKGLLYKGHKVVWWWAQGGTALSAGEVGNAYRTVDDPSIFVRFPLVDENASLVVWTTTPWTLSSNMYAAVHAQVRYAYVSDGAEVFVVAESLVPALAEKWGKTLSTEQTVLGSELIGRAYVPPFDTFRKDHAAGDARYFRVVAGDRSQGSQPQWFVDLSQGTGIVHLAPAFGEDDWKVWRKLGSQFLDLEMFCAVEPDGRFGSRMADLGLEGVWVKAGDRAVIQALRDAKKLIHEETYRHEYPFCWRSDNDPLIQYAREAWFIRTTQEIDRVIENNRKVQWSPEHIRDGRFGDFLDSNVDWALSRERFWGTPLNVWVCEGCEAMDAPSSCADIEARNPDAFVVFREAKAKDPSLSEHLIVHKPWIDSVTFPCGKCGGTMRRVTEVIDCWFDSGCMPFAQFGYPHQDGSVQRFKAAFPADFISEAIDQTRGWFYSLMTISNLLFDAPTPRPYKRCIVLGHVLDRVGKKESKSVGNYTPPEVILDATRMEFASVSEAFAGAKGRGLPEPGTAFIGIEDLEGLDLQDGDSAEVYLKESPSERRTICLRLDKRLPRRVVVLSSAEREALGAGVVELTSVTPWQVPSLPRGDRVMVECASVPAPGADAFRWFFYASNPPWNNVRHSLSNVRALQKELPLKLRNVHSFFVTYANIDRFHPERDEPLRRRIRKRPLLDRWIISELEQLKISLVQEMDAYRVYETSQLLTEFVDGLSNWYVRRSRERFWAEGRGQDKMDAYWTLYRCLRDLAILLAPFLPFLAEEMYQNLVFEPCGDGYPDSVHLRLLPEGDGTRIDASLSKDMADVRALVSLGLQVRANQRLKVRQPLRSAKVVLADPSGWERLSKYVEVMQDELNVREIERVSDADQFVTYRVKPNFPVLGKRLGKDMKRVQSALNDANPIVLKATLEEEGEVVLRTHGEDFILSGEDLLFQVEAKDGFAAASGVVGVVILDTTIDTSLEEEGLFREILSKVQTCRKEGKLDYASRIRLGLSGSDRLLVISRQFSDTLAKETLATDIRFGESLGQPAHDCTIEGEDFSIQIQDLGKPG